MLVAIRPRVRGWDRRTWIGVGMLGLGLAGMNALIYIAIGSIPIGNVELPYRYVLAFATIVIGYGYYRLKSPKGMDPR